ncbi:hypothetical protein BV22DRAFT_135213 [Leucogyrophana mollusca]|uniref:Uncharacterized protein n=1 Tax=Leucogyrophana mollusca TaxID=85980 RepID=A0ACB8BXM0_9AGAM|nr:hypothetical protein BV22DRAFT_135213 [Leucogyrophana mollusca]
MFDLILGGRGGRSLSSFYFVANWTAGQTAMAKGIKTVGLLPTNLSSISASCRHLHSQTPSPSPSPPPHRQQDMEQVLKNPDMAAILPVVDQPGDPIAQEDLGVKFTALSAMVVGQQTLIADLVMELAEERAKYKSIRTRMKNNEKEYEVFRGNLLTELVNTAREQQRQQAVFDSLRREMTQKIAVCEAELASLKLSVTLDKTARMSLEASGQSAKDARRVKIHPEVARRLIERGLMPASDAEDIKVRSPCTEDDKEIFSASSTGTTLTRTISAVSSASSTLASETVDVKVVPTAEPMKISTLPAQAPRKSLLPGVPSRFSKVVKYGKGPVPPTRAEYADKENRSTLASISRTGSTVSVPSTSGASTNQKAAKTVPTVKPKKVLSLPPRKSLLPGLPKGFSKTVKDVKSPAVASVGVKSAPIKKSIAKVVPVSKKLSTTKTNASVVLSSSSSLEALDNALAQSRAENLAAARRSTGSTPPLVTKVPSLASRRRNDHRGSSIYA